MSTEILSGNWKQHPTYKNYYFCDDGRVMSKAKKNSSILAGTKCGQQKYIGIPVKGSKKIYVHRTVCELFNGKPKKGQVCRHLDGDKYNNSASNLAWGSHYENSQDSIKHGKTRFGDKNPMAKLTKNNVEKIRAIRLETQMPYHKLAKLFNISTMTAFRAATKRSWT
jgi:hypothetical protein